MGLRIGFSHAPDSEPYPNYHRALLAAAARLGIEAETLDLSEFASVPVIDGLVFTGGPDINPERYGKAHERGRCEEPDDERDEREFNLFGIAQTRQLPILGICRGLQLLNVAFGGDLITDISNARSHKRKGLNDSVHGLRAAPGSLIADLAGERAADVNSSHHQAVDRVANELVVSAHAEDGTVEALERAQPADKPFLLAVQWHPERMEQSHALAGGLFERFLLAVEASSRSSV